MLSPSKRHRRLGRASFDPVSKRCGEVFQVGCVSQTGEGLIDHRNSHAVNVVGSIASLTIRNAGELS